MSATVITYERGNTYVEHVYTEKTTDPKTKQEIKTSKKAYGLVGTLTVAGCAFDTLERMQGYVHMKPGTYPMSSMYEDSKRGTVVNPWLGKTAEGTKLKGILFHSGSRPEHFEGCIGAGFLKPDGLLDQSPLIMDLIWDLCGGTEKDNSIIVTVSVVGDMPDIKNCTKA